MSFLGGWSVDLSTVALLAIVLWLDGWRRVSGDGILVARAGWGQWTVGAPWAQAGHFALVAWWPPIVMPMLVPIPSTPAPRGDRPPWAVDFRMALVRGQRRLRRVRFSLSTLRSFGVLLLAWITLGIPLLTSRFGAAGLIRGIVTAFAIAVMMALVTTFTLRRLGATLGSSVRQSFALVSPFSACRAAELVVAAALDDLDPLHRVAALLGETRFLNWLRPLAYDALRPSSRAADREPSPIASLVRTLPRDLLTRAASVPSVGEGGSTYCPRCARLYREDATTCADCDDVLLVR
jgi:hypothetical protein